MKQTQDNNTPNQSLVMKRLFNKPRELVWKAWTEAKHAKEWWGPKLFTAPVINVDLRVGGNYL